MMWYFSAFCFALSFFGATDAVHGNNTSFKFLLMLASGSTSGLGHSEVLTAVNQTLDKINRDTSILFGHNLEYVLSDTIKV